MPPHPLAPQRRMLMSLVLGGASCAPTLPHPHRRTVRHTTLRVLQALRSFASSSLLLFAKHWNAGQTVPLDNGIDGSVLGAEAEHALVAPMYILPSTTSGEPVPFARLARPLILMGPSGNVNGLNGQSSWPFRPRRIFWRRVTAADATQVRLAWRCEIARTARVAL